MKKILVISCLLVGCLIAMGAPTASAAARLLITDGVPAHYKSILDGSSLDEDSDAGVIKYTQDIGIWNFNVDAGITKPFAGSASSPEMHLSVTGHSTTNGTLTVWFLDQGFTPGTYDELFSVGGTANGTIDAYLSTQNLGDLYADGGGPGYDGLPGFSFNQNVSVPVGSLTDYIMMSTIISNFSAGSSSVDLNLTPVPEPGTMMLLGSGLVGLAGWGRKKFRK